MAAVIIPILVVLFTCSIWGLIFVIPEMMIGFNALEVTIGRYFFYGLISMALFIYNYRRGGMRFRFKIWALALFFSLFTSIGYYTFVVMALRYSTPSICALILGLSPITIALCSNWKNREFNFRDLFWPCLLILLGLLVINLPEIWQSESPSTYFIGLLCSLWAMVCWTWFVLANSNFLYKNPDVRGSDWSALLGIGSFFWVMLFALLLHFFFEGEIALTKYGLFDPKVGRFILGSMILGFLCSWTGNYLWNVYSQKLPTTLAGQLTIFETVFGLFFIYALEGGFPPVYETVGILLILLSTAIALYKLTRSPQNRATDSQVPLA